MAKTRSKKSGLVIIDFEKGTISPATGEEPTSKIYIAQQKYIKKHCSKKAAAMANYGWSTSNDEDDMPVVATKVYGFGILTTMFNDGEIVHEFEEFSK